MRGGLTGEEDREEEDGVKKIAVIFETDSKQLSYCVVIDRDKGTSFPKFIAYIRNLEGDWMNLLSHSKNNSRSFTASLAT